MLRKKILLNKLLEDREESATIIQENYKIYLMKKDLYALAKKHVNYYSVYPSFFSEKEYTKKNKVDIKIYTDLRNYEKYRILPVRFCFLRNCYVFDIPKSKFPYSKKIMRFNFIINEKIIIEPSYKIIKIGEDFVNEIDFAEIKKNNKIMYEDSDNNSCDDSVEMNNKTEPLQIRFFNEIKSDSKEINDLTNSTNSSTKESATIGNNSTKKKHRKKKSILKRSKSKRLNNSVRRVSFGMVKYSY